MDTITCKPNTMNNIASNAQTYFSLTDFPQLISLKQHWLQIREEFNQLNAPLMPIHRADKSREELFQEVFQHISNGNQYGFVLGWGAHGGNKNWIQFGLMMHDKAVPFLNTEAPKTMELLHQIDGVKMAAFIILKPHTTLHCHTHPEIHDEGLVQLHLPLKTAKHNNFNYLNVAGEFRQHIEGEPIIFDGSYDHFAVNESSEDRVILYLELRKDGLAYL